MFAVYFLFLLKSILQEVITIQRNNPPKRRAVAILIIQIVHTQRVWASYVQKCDQKGMMS